MNLLFYTVYQFLMKIASWTGLSYETVNVIVYYICIPLVFFLLIDKIMRRHICVISFGIALLAGGLCIKDFNTFCDALFEDSVDFLESLACIGLAYDTASVVVCVFAPLVVFAILFYCAFPNVIARHFPTLKKAVQALGKKPA